MMELMTDVSTPLPMDPPAHLPICIWQSAALWQPLINTVQEAKQRLILFWVHKYLLNTLYMSHRTGETSIKHSPSRTQSKNQLKTGNSLNANLKPANWWKQSCHSIKFFSQCPEFIGTPRICLILCWRWWDKRSDWLWLWAKLGAASSIEAAPHERLLVWLFSQGSTGWELL